MDILTVRMHGEKDRSPLEFISAERLAYLKSCEAELLRLRAEAHMPNLDGESLKTTL